MCLAQEPPFECFGVTDLERVFEDGYKCPPPQKRIEVFGIRNEVLSAQVRRQGPTGAARSDRLRRTAEAQGRRWQYAGRGRDLELRRLDPACREFAESPQGRLHPGRAGPFPGLPVRSQADGRGRRTLSGHLPDDSRAEGCPAGRLRGHRDFPRGPGREDAAAGCSRSFP